MVSRCPSCGSPTPEDEKVCPSCGWDFVARKCMKPEPSRPAAPAAQGGFALPPARNLNLPPVGEPTGLTSLPKLEPHGSIGPAEGENPFTLPTARGMPPPEAPLKKTPPAGNAISAAAAAQGGLGARLFRSLRGETAKPAETAAPKETPIHDAPRAPERKGFPLPPARLIKGDDPAVPARRTPDNEPPVKKTPLAPPEPAARSDGDVEPFASAPAESLLPSSARESVPAASQMPPAPARAKPSAPPAEPPIAAESRMSMVMIAAIAGGALGTVSVLAVYLLMRPDTAPGTAGTASSPFGQPGSVPIARPAFPPVPGSAPVPAPAPAPAPRTAPAPQQSPAPLLELPRPLPGPIVSPAPAPAPDVSRPAATFGATPRLVVTGEEPKPKSAPKPAAASAPAREPKARKPKGPRWVFEGVVFDLLTTHGVFGAKLVFLDADGNVVGETDTGPAGRYKVSLPAGPGYKLKISHGDYTDRYIDEGDATSSLREATPEERRVLMSAAARNLPWAGDPAKPVHRDLALIPKTPEEP